MALRLRSLWQLLSPFTFGLEALGILKPADRRRKKNM